MTKWPIEVSAAYSHETAIARAEYEKFTGASLLCREYDLSARRRWRI